MAGPAQVYIKNTFFEPIDDGAPPPISSLERAQTDTAAQHRVSDFGLDEASMEFVDRGVVKVEPVQEEEDEDGADDAAPPPPPGDLYRFTTYNEYESTDDLMSDPFFRDGGGGELLVGGELLPPALGQEAPQEVPQQVFQPPPVATPGLGQPAMGQTYQAYQMLPICVGPQGIVPVQQLPLQQDPRWMEFASQSSPQPTGDAPAAIGGNLVPPPVPEAIGAEAAAAAPASSSGALEGDRLELPPPPREPVLQRAMSVNSQVYRVRWAVDSRKLKGTDREAVSPCFDLSFGQQVQFKMVLRPKAISEGRGGASFKKSKGKGSVFVRCLDEVTGDMNPTVKYRISVGDTTRGPVVHDFSRRAISGLPEDDAEWDFSLCVNSETDTFTICLEIMPQDRSPIFIQGGHAD